MAIIRHKQYCIYIQIGGKHIDTLVTANKALPAPVAHPPSAETDDGALSNMWDGIAPNSSVSFSSASIMLPVDDAEATAESTRIVFVSRVVPFEELHVY